MEFITRNIAVNLKRIRRARKLSLDEVAEQTGVSKSMLGQIERGDSNPTVATVAKITDGLRIPFSSLIESPKLDVYIIPRKNSSPAKHVEGEYSVYSSFPFEDDREFEIYNIEIEPHCAYESGAHGERTHEYIVVNEGELTVQLENEKSFTLLKDDCARFPCDKFHKYLNTGEDKLKFTVFFCFTTKFF